MKFVKLFLFSCLLPLALSAMVLEHDADTLKQSTPKIVINNLVDNGKEPFSPSKTISFYVNEPVFVNIKVTRLNGELVKTIRAEMLLPGKYICEWDGRNSRNQTVKSGVYQYMIQTEGFEYQKTLAFLE